MKSLKLSLSKFDKGDLLTGGGFTGEATRLEPLLYRFTGEATRLEPLLFGNVFSAVRILKQLCTLYFGKVTLEVSQED